jgi:hypothetical protein
VVGASPTGLPVGGCVSAKEEVAVGLGVAAGGEPLPHPTRVKVATVASKAILVKPEAKAKASLPLLKTK